MKKLKIFEHISLEGEIQLSCEDGDFAYGDWTAPYRTPAGRDAVLALYGGSFDLLLGRRHLRCLVGLLAEGAEQSYV